jgi:hypothetical protein
MNNSNTVTSPVDDRQVDDLAVTHRIAFVLNSSLDRGASSNRCAVLATGLAARHSEILGWDLTTSDDVHLAGFTKVPVAVLTVKDQSLRDLAKRAQELGCTVLVFLARAQGMRSYSAYATSVSGSSWAELDIDAVAIFGTKKAVNSVSGALPCLR